MLRHLLPLLHQFVWVSSTTSFVLLLLRRDGSLEPRAGLEAIQTLVSLQSEMPPPGHSSVAPCRLVGRVHRFAGVAPACPNGYPYRDGFSLPGHRVFHAPPSACRSFHPGLTGNCAEGVSSFAREFGGGGSEFATLG